MIKATESLIWCKTVHNSFHLYCLQFYHYFVIFNNEYHVILLHEWLNLQFPYSREEL